MNQKPFLPLRYDRAFKGFFSKEENKAFLMAMLNQYLNLGIEKEEEIEFLNTKIVPDKKFEKMPRLDLVVQTKNSEKINVEMQLTNKTFLLRRCYYYNAKMYSRQPIYGENYSKLKKAMSLTFSMFPIFDNKHYINHLGIKNLKTNEHLLNKEFSMTFVELSKYKKQKIKNSFEEDLWAELLLASSIQECDIISTKGGLMSEAVKKLKYFSQEEIDSYWPDMFEKAELDRKAELEYAREEGLELGKKEGLELGKKEGLKLGKKEGIEQGIEQGIDVAKHQMAKKMLSAGEPLEKVILFTGLTKEEIERILASQN